MVGLDILNCYNCRCKSNSANNTVASFFIYLLIYLFVESRAVGSFPIRKWLVLRYVTPIKRIREERVSAHLLIYSFLLFKLSLRFGLDFEFMLGLMLWLDLGLEFGLGLGLG